MYRPEESTGGASAGTPKGLAVDGSPPVMASVVASPSTRAPSVVGGVSCIRVLAGVGEESRRWQRPSDRIRVRMSVGSLAAQ